MDVQRKLRQHLRSHTKIIPSVVLFVNKSYGIKIVSLCILKLLWKCAILNMT